jgi:hypothetical protein
MRISKYSMLLLFSTLLLISCSSDDKSNETVTQIKQDPLIQSYKFTLNMAPFDPTATVRESLLIGSINENRIQKTLWEFFIEGVSQGAAIEQGIYEYDSNDYLIYYNKGIPQNDDIKEYTYDGNGNVAGLTWTLNGSPQYYRIVHPSANITYFESISLPYNDPNTITGLRHILEFDDNDNIIKAGRDSNFDDILDFENIFTYDSNNNLTNVQMANGDMVTFSYSSIINTQQYLLDKTYGRKLARLIYAEKYGHKGVAGFLNDLIEKSYNITIEATTEAEYEVLDNNFYYKRTEFGVNSVGTGTETRTTEYYF